MSSEESVEARIIFGIGAVEKLPSFLVERSLQRAFVVIPAGRTRVLSELKRVLGDYITAVFSDPAEHVPVEAVNNAWKLLSTSDADVIITAGGGSSIGLGKALVLRTALPLIAVPTTYSGSEMTSIYGTTDTSGKQTGRDDRVRPQVVAYDPEFTLDLSREMSAASGMNALAHAIEAMYAPNATADTSNWAAESIELFSDSLPKIMRDPLDLAARTAAFRGAHLAGRALDATAMGLHHRICHVLGGSFAMPHARTHAVMLPYVMAYNSSSAQAAMVNVASALGVSNALAGVVDLSQRLPVPRSLSELGFEKADFRSAAVEVVARKYPNPRHTSVEEVMRILEAAYLGGSAEALCQ